VLIGAHSSMFRCRAAILKYFRIRVRVRFSGAIRNGGPESYVPIDSTMFPSQGLLLLLEWKKQETPVSVTGMNYAYPVRHGRPASAMRKV